MELGIRKHITPLISILPRREHFALQSKIQRFQQASLAQQTLADRSRTKMEGARSLLAHIEAEGDRLKSCCKQSSAEL